jgi:hypothetical protein
MSQGGTESYVRPSTRGVYQIARLDTIWRQAGLPPAATDRTARHEGGFPEQWSLGRGSCLPVRPSAQPG